MYTYIGIKPIQEEVPREFRYLFITKEYQKPYPEKGKKKCTKEQMDMYKAVTNKRKKMFSMLDSGHYDIGNNWIRLESFVSDFNFLFKGDCYVYKINPINSRSERKIYNNSVQDYYTSKFDVEKRIDNIYELIDDFSDDDYCYNILFWLIFNIGIVNDREESINLFKYAKDKYPSKKIYLSKCVKNRSNGDRYITYKDLPEKEEYIYSLLHDGLIELIGESDYYNNDVVNDLIIAGWFNIAIDYIKRIPENLIDKESIYAIKTLRNNINKESVREILELLKLKDIGLVLNVMRINSFDEDEIADKIIFENMNAVRSYVIRTYGVPFDVACLDVEEWRGDNGEWFVITEDV